ncbi:MAG: hypothetical protein K5778_00015 [Bacteroidaceae bacterium]|nr:hypothetical protein [Bacteroidaceae bacterium]
MKKISLLAGVLIVSMVALAQEKVTADISADFVSRYIWRGQDLGHVSLQPTLGLSYKGLSLTAWGSVGLADAQDTREIDLTLDYAIGRFHACVTDYWTDDGADPDGRYFMYEAHRTNHVLEANVGYDFGLFTADWYTNFAGNDGLNNREERAYSSYFELNAPFRLGGCDWTATLGAVPYATDFYHCSGFAVTTATLRVKRDIRLTDHFSLPLFAQFAANPQSQHAYLVVGLTLHP